MDKKDSNKKSSKKDIIDNDFETQLLDVNIKTRRNEKKVSSKKKTPIKNKKTEKKFAKHKVLKIFMLLLMIFSLFLVFIIGFFVVKYKGQLTPVNNNTFYVGKMTTNVYDRNKEYIGSLSRNGIRWTDIKDKDGKYLVSENYLNGLIATEDKNFYYHGGIDYIGMAKAAVSTIFSDNDRGGSSITMQLAKILYMNDWVTPNEAGIEKRYEDKIGYKVTQMLYAHQIERNFNKDQILENYINVIGFGNAGYGIVNASSYYYGKTPSELTLPEAALLAGMSQLPGIYNPYTNPEETLKRRNVVLQRMLEERKISKEDYQNAINTPIDAGLMNDDNRPISDFNKCQGYLDIVYREFLDVVNKNNSDSFDINTVGMDIYTSMDRKLQEGIYDILNSNQANLFPDKYLQAGVVLMDSKTGEVLAVGSGRNGQQGFFGTNYAYNYNRQPGSTSKPIVAAGPAIEYLDWSSAHPLEDKPTSYDGGPEVHNADGKYLGWISLRESLGKSRNTTALETFKTVAKEKGVNSIYNFVTNLGFTQIKKDDFNQAYAIGGWQYGTTPYQLAGAYGAFGNGGIYNTPHTIKKITISPDSKYYEQYQGEITPHIVTKRVMKESTAFIMSEMLKSSNPDARGYAPYSPSMPELSVKTGTSDWGEAGKVYGIPNAAQRDKWVAGFNNNLTLVTWNGYNQEAEKEGKYIGFNTNYDKNMYKAIVNMVANNIDKQYLENGRLSQPDNVVQKGAVIGKDKIIPSEKGSKYWFIKDSNDYKAVEQQIQENQVLPPENINIDVNQQEANVKITWQENPQTKGSSFVILIDNKEFKKVDSPTITITFNELANFAGCKKTYNISLLSEKNVNGQNIRSNSSELKEITLADDSFCNIPNTPPNQDDPQNDNQTPNTQT